MDRQTLWVWSGWERQDAESRQGGVEMVLPRPPLGQMQGEAAGLAGEASGQGEETSPEGLGGCHWFAQTDARGPTGEIVGQHLHGQPGGVGGEAS